MRSIGRSTLHVFPDGSANRAAGATLNRLLAHTEGSERYHIRCRPRGTRFARSRKPEETFSEESGPPQGGKKGNEMLGTIIIILLVLWLLGFFVFNVGSLIHILLVIAIVVVLIRVIQGRRVV
jgi:Family of unknown function (DUF5670)